MKNDNEWREKEDSEDEFDEDSEGGDYENEEGEKKDYDVIPVKNDNVYVTKKKGEKKYCVLDFEEDDVSYEYWNNLDNMLKDIGYWILYFGYDDGKYEVYCIIHRDLIRVGVSTDELDDRAPHYCITGIHTEEEIKKVIDMVDSVGSYLKAPIPEHCEYRWAVNDDGEINKWNEDNMKRCDRDEGEGDSDDSE